MLISSPRHIIGLLFHIAEYVQRYVGKLSLTAWCIVLYQ
ncbi:hypothetical protein QE382_003477 [Sphingobacterium zeae]|uniref:Uncharacterized protein n=1 Tax=Sphingobacterium zeae TaxID=1776859 RepID=A0ABU0U9F9_9SPHI|nr:hypothetical protein [Sphingobacterium zeae]